MGQLATLNYGAIYQNIIVDFTKKRGAIAPRFQFSSPVFTIQSVYLSQEIYSVKKYTQQKTALSKQGAEAPCFYSAYADFRSDRPSALRYLDDSRGRSLGKPESIAFFA